MHIHLTEMISWKLKFSFETESERFYVFIAALLSLFNFPEIRSALKNDKLQSAAANQLHPFS